MNLDNPEMAWFAGGFLLTIVAALGLAVIGIAAQAPAPPAPAMIGGLTTEQHQMLMETHCYVRGGEWGPIHGCTMMAGAGACAEIHGCTMMMMED